MVISRNGHIRGLSVHFQQRYCIHSHDLVIPASTLKLQASLGLMNMVIRYSTNAGTGPNALGMSVSTLVQIPEAAILTFYFRLELRTVRSEAAVALMRITGLYSPLYLSPRRMGAYRLLENFWSAGLGSCLCFRIHACDYWEATPYCGSRMDLCECFRALVLLAPYRRKTNIMLGLFGINRKLMSFLSL